MIGTGGNLADQAANAMLRYRAQQPLIDALLGELGIKGGDINGYAAAVGQEASVVENPIASAAT